MKWAWMVVLLGGVAAAGARDESASAEWHPGKAPLMTRWAADVDPANPLPEYPRPQFAREDWMSLNGLWDCGITPDSATNFPSLARKILVPFPIESALSGVMTNLDEHSKLWYRKKFTVPEKWNGRHVRLHFGGVDWECEVWINGRPIGRHQGGYDAFTFDVTGALKGGGEDLVVCVADPTEGDQPRGKQSRTPEGIFYTSTSGIWRTVWLEPTPEICIDHLRLEPDVDSKSLRVHVAVNSFSESLRAEMVASAQGVEVARAAGPANGTLTMGVPDARLWSPEDPFLYDLKVTLKDGGKVLDTVTSYFGMRKISLRQDDRGFTRMALNNRPIFQIGTLDQGFWPDGIYTAPTDEALRSDIKFLKDAGFNFTRKHVKTEPERWYYWCDRLGLLVWQDMPSGNNATPAGRLEFESELRRMVDGLENHPSIILWVLFNEGWGQYDTKSLADWLKSRDPSRLVDDASGWTDMRAGDLIDMHNYPGPDSPTPESSRAAVLGEFGGYGLTVSNHQWSARSWGYQMLPDATDLALRYTQALKQVWRLHNLNGLSAAVYTQTTDVETECNGLQTYDRAVAKLPPEILLAANQSGRLNAPRQIVVTDGFFGRANWKYTFDQPQEGWNAPGFDALAWKIGPGGFGTSGTPGIFVKTRWATSDIWLRQEFALDIKVPQELRLHVFHDEDAEIYLNGVLAAKLSGFITDYEEFEIARPAMSALHPGTNTLAVHCRQTTGGQGIDVGLVVPAPELIITSPTASDGKP